MTFFINEEQSHTHSLELLNGLYEYSEFMESIVSMVDLGCGNGRDIEWWATRTTNEDNPKPLNINCVGVDILPGLLVAHEYSNITYQKTDFEETITPPNSRKFDVLWCHDAFQYCVNPLSTLAKWKQIANDNAMLVLTVPQTTNVKQTRFDFTQPSGVYYHYTLVNLIHMLAVSGWDCQSGFFLKRPTDPWINIIVYNRESQEPLNPKTTSWYELAEKKLIPDSAAESVFRHGCLKQQELLLPWLDHSLSLLGQQ